MFAIRGDFSTWNGGTKGFRRTTDWGFMVYNGRFPTARSCNVGACEKKFGSDGLRICCARTYVENIKRGQNNGAAYLSVNVRCLHSVQGFH
jgi:hypothetical protein